MKTSILTISTQQDLEREIAGFLRRPAERRELRIVPMRVAVDMSAILSPTCEHCGKPAECFGSYEEMQPGYACGECCGHGNEDGRCDYVADDEWGPSEDTARIHRVTVAGGSEPLHPQWVRDVRDACISASVCFGFLGWGDWCVRDQMPIESEFGPVHESLWFSLAGCKLNTPIWPGIDWVNILRVGSFRSGRMLDGRTLEWK